MVVALQKHEQNTSGTQSATCTKSKHRPQVEMNSGMSIGFLKSADFRMFLAKDGPSTLQNAALGPFRAKSSILQGEEREMFDCHPSCSRYENNKIHKFSTEF